MPTLALPKGHNLPFPKGHKAQTQESESHAIAEALGRMSRQLDELSEMPQSMLTIELRCEQMNERLWSLEEMMQTSHVAMTGSNKPDPHDWLMLPGGADQEQKTLLVLKLLERKRELRAADDRNDYSSDRPPTNRGITSHRDKTRGGGVKVRPKGPRDSEPLPMQRVTPRMEGVNEEEDGVGQEGMCSSGMCSIGAGGMASDAPPQLDLMLGAEPMDPAPQPPVANREVGFVGTPAVSSPDTTLAVSVPDNEAVCNSSVEPETNSVDSLVDVDPFLRPHELDRVIKSKTMADQWVHKTRAHKRSVLSHRADMKKNAFVEESVSHARLSLWAHHARTHPLIFVYCCTFTQAFAFAPGVETKGQEGDSPAST